MIGKLHVACVSVATPSRRLPCVTFAALGRCAVELLREWFGPQGTLPHGFCYQWNPTLIWLHAVSDVLIALAYFSIPVVLLQFVRKRRDLPFDWMFVCFAVFIAACGSTHLAEVWTLWVPAYWLSGGIKVVTALASLPTAVFLIRLLPRALLLPSPAAMRAANLELQQQQASLRESEDRYRDLVEHSTDLICTHTLDGRLLTVNEPPVQLLGYTREELLNKSMRDFLLPEFRSEFDRALETLKKQGSIQGHMVVLTKSGERRIWEFHNTLRTDGVSAPIVRGVAHDVTEQKRMEKALRVSEEKFSKAFLASPYSISISSMDEDRLLEANDSFFVLTGYSREECLGRPYLDLPVWTSPAAKSEILREIKDQGRVRSKQLTMQTKSGGQIVVSYSAELIEVGHRTCLLSICEDITERKRAEARLLEYEKAFEGVEEMIAVVGRDFRYLLANHAFASFCGLEKKQVIGSLVSEIIDADFFEHAVTNHLQ